MVWVQSLVWELLPALGMAKNKNKNKKKTKNVNIGVKKPTCKRNVCG